MEKNEKDAITSSLYYLCQNTTSLTQLVILAMSALLMTESEVEEILSETSSFSKNRAFYFHMMKKTGGMDHLLRFLREVKNDTVARHLEDKLHIQEMSIQFQNANLASSSRSQLHTHFNLYFSSRYFTGRKSHLLTLDNTIKTLLKEKRPGNKTVVISGLGGVGKTELVREYATTTDTVKYVIVINALSYATAKKDFEDLADVLRASDPTFFENRKIQNVYRYFSEQIDGKTLFVFENAGHWEGFVKFLPNESVGPVNNQLPIVLIISRRKDWAFPKRNHMHIHKWEDDEAVQYLTRRFEEQEMPVSENVRLSMRDLGNFLHCYPLGLSIAISKIFKDHEHSAVNKIKNYLLANKEYHDTWRVQEISNSELTDYKLTMDTVFNADIQNIYSNKDDGVKALELLRLVSNFCPLHPGINPVITTLEMQELCAKNKLNPEVAEALSLLYNYSIFLGHKNEDWELLSSQIHDIFQLCRGKWTGIYLEQFCNRNEIWV